MMTSTDAGQISIECDLWRDQLRSFRDTLRHYKEKLKTSVSYQSTKEDILQLEHLYNQLHIQLINVHDLKQAVKRNVQKMEYEKENGGRVSDGTLAKHEFLREEFHTLDATLSMIREELEDFISASAV